MSMEEEKGPIPGAQSLRGPDCFLTNHYIDRGFLKFSFHLGHGISLGTSEELPRHLLGFKLFIFLYFLKCRIFIKIKINCMISLEKCQIFFFFT